MTAFHDALFPLPVGLNASGGPERLTEIVELASGREERNSPWANSRRRWDAGPGLRTLDDLAELTAFFEARRGRLHAFRFRDPVDHKSCAPSKDPAATDQVIATGDSVETEFSLIKRYGAGASQWTRHIAKPVRPSVLAAVDGAPAAFSVLADGRIRFDAPPAAGASVSAGFLFDTPARFDVDRLEISLEGFAAGQAVSVPLVEVRID